MGYWTWEHRSWPHFNVDYSVLAEQIMSTQNAVEKLNQSVEWLPNDSSESLQIETLCLESVGTAAIEGVVIDPNAVRSSIAKKLGTNTAGWKSPPREVDGLVAILMTAAEKWNEELTKEALSSWHGALFPTGRSGLDPILTAQYRKEDVHIVSGGAMGKRNKIHYRGVPPERVEQEMEAFLKWFNETAKEPSLVRAAVAHFWFEAIHPFEDGNGRIGRVVLDVALAQNDQSARRFFSISHQLSTHRGQYVNSMGFINHLTDEQSLDITPWVSFFLDQTHQSVLQSQTGVDMALMKNKFWADCSHISFNERQRKVLNKILEVGPEGFVGGINNSKYASMGQTSRATATRELAELTGLGVLVAEGGGRSRTYRFDWEKLMKPIQKNKSLKL